MQRLNEAGGGISQEVPIIKSVDVTIKPSSYANASSGASVANTTPDATSIQPPIKLTKTLVILGVSIAFKEVFIGLVDKLVSGALDDVISGLTTAKRKAVHALVIELARWFDHVNSDSDTSSEEPNRVTPGVAGVSVSEPSKPKANFCSLLSENMCNGAEFSIPRKVVEAVSTRFDNTLYGYFIGFFFFKFNNSKGLEDVHENGPWMIRNIPIILKKLSMNTRLSKKELTDIPVWVKIHDVSLQVFSEDGISIIASQLESLTMGVPLIEDSGFSIETVRIEYEWKPPHCDLFKIFSHVHDQCPKKATVTPIVEKTNDGFQIVANKKKYGKAKSTNGGKFGGQSVKQSVRYELKAATNMPKMGVSNMVNSSKSGWSHVSLMLKIQSLKANVPHVSSRRSPIVEKGGNIIARRVNGLYMLAIRSVLSGRSPSKSELRRRITKGMKAF
ncbi:zinc knuckle CX2CX4HX4C containing protein [Tanacetum coccineum]